MSKNWFRGLSNGGWAYGYYVLKKVSGEQKHYIVMDGRQTLIKNKDSICQCVGMDDQNEVGMYEDDVVDVYDMTNWKFPKKKGRGIVMYDQEDCTYKIKGNLFLSFIDRFNYNAYEVVGNLHEGGIQK